MFIVKYIKDKNYDEKLSYINGESGLEKVKSGEYLDADSQNLFLKNEGDRATYRVYCPLDSDYNIDLRVPASARGARIGIRVDNGPIKEYTISDDTPFIPSGDSLINITNEIYLDEGQHYISLYNIGDEFVFSLKLNGISDILKKIADNYIRTWKELL